MKTKIKRFGIEIEGEFSDELSDQLNDLNIGKFVTDGSIRECEEGTHNKDYLHSLEFVTEPLIYKDSTDTKDLKGMFQLLDKYYKEGNFHFNDTMGMHIHFSFIPILPSELWSIEFVEYFEKQLKKTYKNLYEQRIQGDYCRKIKNEREIGWGHDRYKEINFRPAYSKHRTIEFRIFPADTPKKMESYLWFTERKINSFIRRENTILSKSFEFEVAGKRKITRVQKVEVDNRQNIKEEKAEVNKPPYSRSQANRIIII